MRNRKQHAPVLKMWFAYGLAAVSVLLLAACGSKPAQKVQEPDRLQIVATTFPAYDWVKSILGENPAGIEFSMLTDNGVDLHSFQPSADDILKIAGSDMFLYIGGSSDEWAESALSDANGRQTRALNLMNELGDRVKNEETVEGMQAEAEESGDEADEHIWLSLNNAEILCERIRQELEALDPDNAQVYQKNTEAYIKQLEDLDARYRETVDMSDLKLLIFADRFPFRYLMDDYGLRYYAAFAGCSAETEASFETVSFLADKVEEEAAGCVITIEGSDRKIAQTVVSNTALKDQKILTMDSMQSVSSKEAEEGKTYVSVMEQNLAVLKEALSQEASQ